MSPASSLTRLVLVWLCWMAAGCSLNEPATLDGGDAAADARDEAAMDAPEVGEEAALEGGPFTFVGRRVEVTAERACDLDGDGVADSAIADLGQPASSVVAGAISSYAQAAIEERARRMIFHAPGVDRAIQADGRDFRIVLFVGVDEDDSPEDDFSGEEAFYARLDSLDECGEPRYLFAQARVDDGELSASGGTLPLPVGRSGNIVLVGRGASAWGTFAPGSNEAEICACAYLSIADLGGQGGFTGTGDLTMLEVLMAGGAAIGVPSMEGLDPDVDLDGDGLERFEVDGDGRIVSCVDGDLTVLDGRDCWSDPRFGDGFAMTFCVELVSARFGGREPGWEDHLSACESLPETSLWDAD